MPVVFRRIMTAHEWNAENEICCRQLEKKLQITFFRNREQQAVNKTCYILKDASRFMCRSFSITWGDRKNAGHMDRITVLLVLLTASTSNGKFQKDRMQFNGFSSRISLRSSHVISLLIFTVHYSCMKLKSHCQFI